MSRYWSRLKIVLWFDQVYLCKMFTVQKNKDSIAPLKISKNNKSRYFCERAAVTLSVFQNLLYKRRVILGYLNCSIFFTKIHSFDQAFVLQTLFCLPFSPFFPLLSLFSFYFFPFPFYPFCSLSFPFPFVNFRNLKVFVLNW